MGSRRLPGLTASCLRLQRTALRRRWTKRLLLSQQQVLQFSCTPSRDNQRVAVIGGGITGLTTAFNLAQKKAPIQVTIYEKSQQLGGWMQSETIQTDGGKVVFEYGPRTLRCSQPYDVLPTLELLALIGLETSLILTSKSAPAALNRYIYYPDRLVRLPGQQPGASLPALVSNAMRIASEPLFKGLLWGILRESFVESRDSSVRDESIADFVARRFGKEPADNIASAVFHGIYAGDIDKLSARTVLPQLWDCELVDGTGGVLMKTIERNSSGQPPLYPYNKHKALTTIISGYPAEYVKLLPRLVAGGSVFTLRDGLNSIITALTEALSRFPNVRIIRGADISHIQHDRAKRSMMLVSANKPAVRYDYVVSTTPSKVLAAQLRGPEGRTSPTATSRLLSTNNYAVNVMVVNLFFSDPNLVPVEGFGYLIPRTIPIEQNPERALGVLFMSDAAAGQDTAEGTKLAVMIGGHWWDGWNRSDFPDEQKGIAMAKAVLARHLGISQEPVVAKARMLHNAIPQHTVGHNERMEELHESLSREYDSRLKVAGAWYTGVGVNDCITSARVLAASMRQGNHDVTGLENFVLPSKPLETL
ncbi:hypothetical protein FQN49_007643 [Arthroderma sp. PD_2]|nr:hypothetical protein FQN49_007643 [Arthroderma sp. PD_2]